MVDPMTFFLAVLALGITALAPAMAAETHSAMPYMVAILGWIAVVCGILMDSMRDQTRYRR